jgi:DNA topoisomerase-1
MLDFSAALPGLRAQVEQDLRKRGFPREKVLALLVTLLEYTLIRIGNPEYARRNHSYGLTTLENEHFEVDGSTLIFSFVGKSGKEQEIELRNRRLANQVAQIQELPGQRQFQYVDEEGHPQSIDSGDVNSYLHEISGQSFSAKDFRTWGATTLAALELYALGPADTQTELKRKVVEAVRRVAEALGNTPAVSRQYYIHPDILTAYTDGSLFLEMQRAAQQVEESPFGLSVEEQAVVAILRKRPANPPARKE